MLPASSYRASLAHLLVAIAASWSLQAGAQTPPEVGPPNPDATGSDKDLAEPVIDSQTEEDKRRWSVSVTLVPRYQPFLTTVGDFGERGFIHSTGLSAIVFDENRPNFAVNLTGFTGRLSGEAENALTGEANFIFRRGDAGAYLEYRPDSANITVYGGGRYFSSEYDADRTSVANSREREDEDYLLAELGVRLQGRLSPESPHQFSTQASFGIGSGKRVQVGEPASDLAIRNSFRGATGEFRKDTKGVGSLFEFAAGWNYLVERRINLGPASMQNLSVGLRVRAYALSIDIGTEDPDLTLAPEFNLSATF
jgi:hypothetical protein